MKRAALFAGACLAALVGCQQPYDHLLLSSGGDTLPRLVQVDDHAATVRHGTIARVLPLVVRSNGVDDDVREGDLLLRSRHPEVLRIDPGRDPVEFYFAAATLGRATVDVFYRGRKVDEIAVEVIAP